jgi:hypothetical protein
MIVDEGTEAAQVRKPPFEMLVSRKNLEERLIRIARERVGESGSRMDTANVECNYNTYQ